MSEAEAVPNHWYFPTVVHDYITSLNILNSIVDVTFPTFMRACDRSCRLSDFLKTQDATCCRVLRRIRCLDLVFIV